MGGQGLLVLIGTTVQCKKVNEVFAIGLRSFVRDTSSQGYNKFVSSRSGVNFIIHCESLMLCSDSFILREHFAKLIANEYLMNV